MPFVPLKHEELRLGLYVRLNGSWFSHPFPTNTFKIRTTKELATLQKLRKVEILFDPDKSDPEVEEILPEDESVEEVAEPPEPEDVKAEEEIPPQPPPKLDPVEAFVQYCEGFKKADRAYQEAFQQSKAVMQDLSTGNIEGVQKAKDIILTLGKLLDNAEAATAFLHVMTSNEMGEGMFLHALNVSTLCLMVGKEFDLSEDELRMLALGALFHDIGELDVPGKILLKRPNLTPGERETYRQHPRFGKDMLQKFSGFPKSSLDAIYQHHERLDGSGYPMGLKGQEAISLFGKIVMVVDRYDDLCHDPDLDKRLTPSEALSHLFVKHKTVFWSEAIVALVRILGVYPPGSIVQLSNGEVGMVANINLRNRLRPLILMYTEDESKDQAVIVDLEAREELSISQNLRPRDVPSHVLEYLNPRRMVNYLPTNYDKELVSTSN